MHKFFGKKHINKRGGVGKTLIPAQKGGEEGWVLATPGYGSGWPDHHNPTRKLGLELDISP